MSTTPIPVPPGPESSDAILAENLNYWHWYCDHQNSVGIASYNVAYANWLSNNPFFVSKGLPHPKPPLPEIIHLIDSEFVNQWDLMVAGGPGNVSGDAAFLNGPCFVKTLYVAPVPPVHRPPVVVPTLGDPIPNQPGKFMVHPGDTSPVGTVITVSGHKYRKIGLPTPFGMETEWQQIS